MSKPSRKNSKRKTKRPPSPNTQQKNVMPASIFEQNQKIKKQDADTKFFSITWKAFVSKHEMIDNNKTGQSEEKMSTVAALRIELKSLGIKIPRGALKAQLKHLLEHTNREKTKAAHPKMQDKEGKEAKEEKENEEEEKKQHEEKGLERLEPVEWSTFDLAPASREMQAPRLRHELKERHAVRESCETRFLAMSDRYLGGGSYAFVVQACDKSETEFRIKQCPYAVRVQDLSRVSSLVAHKPQFWVDIATFMGEKGIGPVVRDAWICTFKKSDMLDLFSPSSVLTSSVQEEKQTFLSSFSDSSSSGSAIPRLYELYEGRQYLFVVMDHLTGMRTMEDVIENVDAWDAWVGRPTTRKAVYREICTNVRKTIKEMHQYGVLHWDLNTTNIFLSDVYPPTVKIIDWEFADFLGRPATKQEEMADLSKSRALKKCLAEERISREEEKEEKRARVRRLRTKHTRRK